jgi:hypothetical protein
VDEVDVQQHWQSRRLLKHCKCSKMKKSETDDGNVQDFHASKSESKCCCHQNAQSAKSIVTILIAI